MLKYSPWNSLGVVVIRPTQRPMKTFKDVLFVVCVNTDYVNKMGNLFARDHRRQIVKVYICESAKTRNTQKDKTGKPVQL